VKYNKTWVCPMEQFSGSFRGLDWTGYIYDECCKHHQESTKQKGWLCVLSFLQQYAVSCHSFLKCIVTGDDTRVHHHTPQMKCASMECKHPGPLKMKKLAPSTKWQPSISFSKGSFWWLQIYKRWWCKDSCDMVVATAWHLRL